MVRVFLDANVVFSAAHRAEAGLLKLWKLRGVVLVSSDYAVVEARLNLDARSQQQRLDKLIQALRLVPEAADDASDSDAPAKLPDKDRPILRAAQRGGCEYLITGDVRHFGSYFGRTIGGVTILPPADFLKRMVRHS